MPFFHCVQVFLESSRTNFTLFLLSDCGFTTAVSTWWEDTYYIEIINYLESRIVECFVLIKFIVTELDNT